eukprot:TRINITY_DN7_c0_g2_i1.p1 TRINITY_DN7_c0_g2~~TRINITY_DN7_c0_g2_i1.p1  ORF type:complete len:487 (+),score=120.08 TRINITY_DN7_c0_g2_i1:90-1463(+)
MAGFACGAEPAGHSTVFPPARWQALRTISPHAAEQLVVLQGKWVSEAAQRFQICGLKATDCQGRQICRVAVGAGGISIAGVCLVDASSSEDRLAWADGDVWHRWGQLCPDCRSPVDKGLCYCQCGRAQIWRRRAEMVLSIRRNEDGSTGMQRDESLRITAVRPGYPADRAGIKVGMRILKVNGARVHTKEDVKRELQAVGRGEVFGVLMLWEPGPDEFDLPESPTSRPRRCTPGTPTAGANARRSGVKAAAGQLDPEPSTAPITQCTQLEPPAGGGDGGAEQRRVSTEGCEQAQAKGMHCRPHNESGGGAPGWACAKCFSGSQMEVLLLCDGKNCGRAWHTFCCSPPYDKVPEVEPWFCEQCVAAGSTEPISQRAAGGGRKRQGAQRHQQAPPSAKRRRTNSRSGFAAASARTGTPPRRTADALGEGQRWGKPGPVRGRFVHCSGRKLQYGASGTKH